MRSPHGFTHAQNLHGRQELERLELELAMAAVRILFIGAGAVNFGGAEGPWDHSRRLEGLQGVRIVGIADPDVLKAKAVLEKKANGKYGEVYGECAVYGDYKEAIKACKPDAAFIGELECKGLCSPRNKARTNRYMC